MVITLMDYKGDLKEFDVGELDTIADMDIIVLTGDEVLEVHYKNGNHITFDSSDSRFMDCYDGQYGLYSSKDPERSRKRMEEFKHRTDTYWFEK